MFKRRLILLLFAAAVIPGNAVAEIYQVPALTDCWITQSAPVENHGTDPELSNKYAPGDAFRTLCKFDLSSIPPSEPILAAWINVYVTTPDISGSPVLVHRVTRNWTEAGANWSNVGLAYDSLVVSGNFTPLTTGVTTIDVTSLVQEWVDGNFVNYGVTFASTSYDVESRYASKEWPVPGQQPRLTVVTSNLGVHVARGRYTGDGLDDRAITGVGFMPDFVIVKGDNDQFAVARSSTMPGDATKTLSEATVLQANLIQSLDIDGFTVGADDRVNQAGGDYYYWAVFAASPGLMAVGSYVGDGTDDRSITGIGFQPGYAIVMSSTNKIAVQRYLDEDIDKCLSFTNDGEKSDRIQDFIADGFEVGGHDTVNKAGDVYHYVVWNTVPGITNNGSYAGDGADDRDITGVGFQPEYLIISNKQHTAVHRSDSLTGDRTLPFDDGAAFGDGIQAFLPDGFQVGTLEEANKNGDDYFWVAFTGGSTANADIRVAASVDDSLKNEGDAATLFVAVDNLGPDDATGVEVADIVPPGLTYVAHNTTRGTYSEIAGIWDIGDLPGGVTAVLSIEITVDPGTAGTTITNNAILTALHQYDPTPSNNSASADIRVQGVLLTVLKTVDNPAPNVGETVGFEVKVFNDGPSGATGVEVLDLLPDGVSYLSDTPSQGTYSGATGSWSVGAIADGDSATLVITGNVDPGTGGSTITNWAKILAADQSRISSPADSASADLTIPSADLSVGKSVSDPTPAVSDQITFTVSVSNAGPDSATGVAVTDSLPSGLSYDSDTPSQGSYSAATGIWSVGALAPGDTARLTLTVTVDSGSEGWVISNIAAASAADQEDPDVLNNSGFTKVSVQSDLFRVATGYYTGNGVDGFAVSGLGFRPSAVIIKGDNSHPTVIRTATMSGDASKSLGTAAALASDRIESLDDDGFTIGSDDRVNEPGVDFYWTALRTSPGVMVAGSYTGDGSDDRSITGVGFAPTYMLVLSDSSYQGIQRFGSQVGDASIQFGSAAEAANAIQALEADGFQIGDDPSVNNPATTHHYVAFAETPGIVSSGFYTGNGGDNRDITGLGFQPEYVLVKMQAALEPAVHRPVSLAGDSTLPVPAGNAFSDGIQAFLPDGFQVGAAGPVNQWPVPYYWAAFADPVAETDLELVKNVDDPAPVLGDTINYTVTLVNNGPNGATGVQVIDLLPAELTLLSAVPGQGTYNGTTGLWNIGAVAAGDSVDLVLSARVAAGSVDSTVTNTAAVVAHLEADPDESNNIASVEVVIGPSEYTVISGSYTGSGLGGRSVSGIGFRPDVVIIKGDFQISAVMRTSTMAGDVTKPLGGKTAAISNAIQSLDPDGFTVGTRNEVNQAGRVYYWTAFRAAKPELVLGTYAGDENDDRSIGGVGFAAAYLVVMDEAAEIAVQRFPAQVGDASLPFTSSNPMADVIQAIEPDGFQVGKHHSVNRLGDSYHYVAWKTVTGRTAGSVYLGDGSDDRDIHSVGFRPDFVVVARNETGSPVLLRSNVHNGDNSMPFSPDSSFSDRIQTFRPDGFQVGSHPDVNETADSYYWMAFDDSRTLDIAVGMVADNLEPNVADTLVYTLTVVNNSVENATNVSVNDALPAGLTYYANSPSQGSYDNGTGEWSVGNLAGGAGAELQLRAVVDPGTGGSIIINTAVLTSVDQTDVDPGNNVASVNVTVRSADLALEKTVDRSFPAEGDTIVYTVLVTNNGPYDATVTTLTDSLPSGITFLSSNTSRGTYNDATGVWSIGTVVNGTTDTLAINAVVDGGSAGSNITNAASITGSQVDDPDEANNSAQVTILVPTPLGLDDEPGSLFPTSAVVGDPALALRIGVNNTWPVGVTLSTSSTVEFTDGTNTYSSYLSNSTYVPAGADNFVLAFSPKALAAGFTADSTYHVVLSLKGSTDESMNYEQTISTAGTNNVFITQPDMELSASLIGAQTVHPGQKDVELLIIGFRNNYTTGRTLDSLTVTNASSGPGTPLQLDALADALKLYDDVDSTGTLTAADTLLCASAFAGGTAGFAPAGVWTVPALAGRFLIVTADVDSTSAPDGNVLDAVITWSGDLAFAEPTNVEPDITPLYPLDSYGGAVIDGMMSHQVSLAASSVDSLFSGADDILVMALEIPWNGYLPDTLTALDVRDFSGGFDTADFDAVKLYRDGGNGVFEPAGDQYLGQMVYSGDRYQISGLSAPTGPGTVFFVSVDVAFNPVNGHTFKPGIPAGGITVKSGNDGPLDAAVVSSVSHVIIRLEKVDVVTLPLPPRVPNPGDRDLPLLRINLQNNTLSAQTLDSLRVRNYTSGPGTQAQLDAEIVRAALYLDDGNGVVDAWDSPVAENLFFSSGSSTTPPLDLTLQPGESSYLLFACDVDSFCVRDQDSLRVGLPADGDLFFTAAPPVGGSFPLITHPPRVADGMMSFQINVLPSSDSLLITETTGILVLDVNVPGNGYDADTLVSLFIENQGTATDEHVQALTLYADGGNERFEKGAGDDVLLGPFVSLGSRQYQISSVGHPIPPACAGGVRLFVSCDLTPDFITGASFQFGVPVDGIEVSSGNDGPIDAPVADPSTQFVPRPDELTVFPNSVGDKRVYPASKNVLNYGMMLYNGYQTEVTLDSLRLFQSGSALAQEIAAVAAFADSDTNGLFNPAVDVKLADGITTDAYYYRFFDVGLDLPPQKITYLFVAYDLSSTVRDSVSVDFQLNGVTELSFTPGSISIKGEPTINSPGVDVTDGMVASQIKMLPARAERAAPGDEHILVMGLTVPPNGLQTDKLAYVTILNSPTATAMAGRDVSTLNLWAENGGDPNGFAPADDRLLGAMPWSGIGWRNASELKALIPHAGLKCYVTFSASPTAVDNTTFQALLPLGGIQVFSGNDGPLDQTLINPNVQTISTDPLITSLSTDRQTYSSGQNIIVYMQVRNEGADTLLAVAAPPLSVSGSAAVIYQSGPSPAAADIAPGADTTLVWSYTAAAAGDVEFCGFARTGDGSEESYSTCTETAVVQNRASEINMSLVDATPIGVNRGQQKVDALGLGFDYALCDSLSAATSFTGLKLSVEDGTGSPLPPNAILEAITLVSSSGSNQPFTLSDSTQNPLHLFFAEEVQIQPGASLGIDLEMDVASGAPLSQFRLLIGGVADISVLDENDGQPVPLVTPATFPWRTNLIDVSTAAESLIVDAGGAGTLTVNLGQDGVPVFRFSLLNNGPATAASEILKSVGLSFFDSAGTAIPPNEVINAITLTSEGSTLFFSENIPTGSGVMTCNLSNPLLLPPQVEKEVVVVVDVKSFPAREGFYLSLQNQNALTARDNNSGGLVVVSAGSQAGTFPVRSPLILFQQPATGLAAVHNSTAPPNILPSSENVQLFEAIYSHADGGGTASSILVDSLALAFVGKTGGPVYPGDYFSQLLVVHSGDTLALIASLSSIDNVVECSFAEPVVFAPSTVETLGVYVDTKDIYAPAEFQVRIEKQYITARDANTGERISLITGEFPFLTDPSRLLLSGGSVQCGLVSRLPANVTGHETALPAFDFIVKNTAPAGYTPVELRSLTVAARTWDGKPMDPSGIAGGAALLRGDSVLASGTIGGSAITFALSAGAAEVPPGRSDTLTVTLDLDAGGEQTFRLAVLDTSSVGVRDAVTSTAVAPGTIGNAGYPLLSAIAHVLGGDVRSAFTNYPNPFAAGHEDTRITYFLESAARVTMKLYTLWGAPVATLIDGREKTAGLHQDVVWSGRNGDGDVVNNGVYYLVLEIESAQGGNKTLKRKIGVIR